MSTTHTGLCITNILRRGSQKKLWSGCIVRCAIEVDDLDSAHEILKRSRWAQEYPILMGGIEEWDFGPQWGVRRVLRSTELRSAHVAKSLFSIPERIHFIHGKAQFARAKMSKRSLSGLSVQSG